MAQDLRAVPDEVPEERLFTISELASLWRKSDTWVRVEIEAGRLPAIDMRKEGTTRAQWRVPTSAAREYIAARTPVLRQTA